MHNSSPRASRGCTQLSLARCRVHCIILKKGWSNVRKPPLLKMCTVYPLDGLCTQTSTAVGSYHTFKIFGNNAMFIDLQLSPGAESPQRSLHTRQVQPHHAQLPADGDVKCQVAPDWLVHSEGSGKTNFSRDYHGIRLGVKPVHRDDICAGVSTCRDTKTIIILYPFIVVDCQMEHAHSFYEMTAGDFR